MRGVRERVGGSDREGQGRAFIPRLHAGLVGLAGGGNGVPLTSGRRAKSRPGRACPDLRFLRPCEVCRGGEIATQPQR